MNPTPDNNKVMNTENKQGPQQQKFKPNPTEIVKMKQGMSYSLKEKTIILNVFKYFRNQYPEKCVTDLVRRTAKATGCSEKSVFQFRKEEASEEGFKEPSKTKIRKNININSRDIKYDSSVRTGIRNIIYDLQYKNIVPSLNTILKQVNADKMLPNFSVMTLRRLMCDMGFYYQKTGNKCILVEKPDTRFMPPNESNQLEHKPLPPVQQEYKYNQLNEPPALPISNIPTQHEPIMGAPSHLMHVHNEMHHKTMPVMMMNSNMRRDIPMEPAPPSHPAHVPAPHMIATMDMHIKRDPIHSSWMHGLIKQGQ